MGFDWGKQEDAPKQEAFSWDNQEDVDAPDMGKSFLHHGLQNYTAGLSDELAGVGEALGQAAGVEGFGLGDPRYMHKSKEGPTLDWDTLRDAYRRARDQERGYLKSATKANPISSGAGSVVGMIGSPLNKIGGALSLAKQGAIIGGLNAAGNSDADLTDPSLENVEHFAGDVGLGTALGGGLGKAVDVASPYIKKGVDKITGGAKSTLDSILEMLPTGKKANAADIESAAERLGVKATPGMVNESQTIQDLENSLHQSPSIGGYLTRKGTKPVGKAMSTATQDLLSDASSATPYESGQTAKKLISEAVENKFEPSTSAFNDLRQYTKDIPSTTASTQAVGRNILNIPEVDVLDLPIAKKVAAKLAENPSADQIKILKGIVGKQAAAAEGAEASGLWKIYGKLNDLEENTIARGVISSSRNGDQGNTIAKGMLGQLKGARKGYAEQMSNLEDFSRASKLGKFAGPDGFGDKIDAIPSEKLQERLLPLEDVRMAKTLQEQFPEAFGNLRRARLRDLSDGVVQDKTALPTKLLQKTKNLNPEAEQMLFGDKASKLNDLRTLDQSLPDMVGPSGTPHGIDVGKMLNPLFQAKELGRYGAYKALSSDTLAKGSEAVRPQIQRISDILAKSPQLADMAQKNPQILSMIAQKLEGHMPEMSKVAEGNKPYDKDALLQKTQGTQYAQVLQNASQRGEQALGATHFILQSRDPSYRDLTLGDESESQDELRD